MQVGKMLKKIDSQIFVNLDHSSERNNGKSTLTFRVSIGYNEMSTAIPANPPLTSGTIKVSWLVVSSIL